MANLSNYAENALINSLFGKTSDFGALASAPTIYVGLTTATVTDSDDGSSITEANYTGYARVSTVAADWDAAVGGMIDNANVITFGQCTAGPQTVTDVVLCDASTGGNLILYKTLTTSRAVAIGDTPNFAAGTLTATAL